MLNPSMRQWIPQYPKENGQMNWHHLAVKGGEQMKKLLVWQFRIMQTACHLLVKTSPVFLFVYFSTLFQHVKNFKADA